MEKNILSFYKKKEPKKANTKMDVKQESENYGSINMFHAANDGGQGITSLQSDATRGKMRQEESFPSVDIQPIEMGFLKQTHPIEGNTGATDVSPDLWTKEMVAEKLKELEHQSQAQEYQLFSKVVENKDMNAVENKDNVIAFGGVAKGGKPTEPVPLVIAPKEAEEITITPLAEVQVGNMPVAEEKSIEGISKLFEKPKPMPTEPMLNENLNFSNLFKNAEQPSFTDLFKPSDKPNFFGNYSKTSDTAEDTVQMADIEDRTDVTSTPSDSERFEMVEEELMVETEGEDEFFALEQGIMSLEADESEALDFLEEEPFASSFEMTETSIGQGISIPETAEAEVQQIEQAEFEIENEEQPKSFISMAKVEKPLEKDYWDAYSDENAYHVSNMYNDLRGFIRVCDDGQLRKVTLLEPNNEKMILINSAFSKILLTDAFVMIEDRRIEEAKELLEKICFTSLDAKVANRAFLKLEELKEKYDFRDMPQTFHQCLNKEKQLIEQLKKIQ